MAFNFPFIEAAFEAEPMSAVVDQTVKLLPDDAWPVWTGSNHDVSHLATRWAGGDVAKVKLALMMLLTLRGTPVLYEGDEIGLEDTSIERDDVLDPVGIRFWPVLQRARPRAQPDAVATRRGRRIHRSGCQAVGADGGPRSFQRLGPACRPELGDELRARPDRVCDDPTPDLQVGDSVNLPAPDGCWAWRRGKSLTVVLNMSDADARLEAVEGRIVACTDRSRDGEKIDKSLTLKGWTGVVVTAG